MIPHRTPFFLPLIYPTLHWRLGKEKKELYLTFDDGPVPGPTEFVLDTLKMFQVHATFFCIGDNVRKHTQLANRIINEGHQIGNHTFNHVNGWKENLQDYVSNVKQCDQELQPYRSGNTGKKLFRPPFGRITKQEIRQLSEYEIIMWDVLSIDYNKNVSPEACFQNTLKVTRPGSIIVFHDSIKAEKNLYYALPRFIEKCLESGYVFKRIIL
jgi:peptidoglycan/xylan/chitin deacetylase (PgdA/CDA1 family)